MHILTNFLSQNFTGNPYTFIASAIISYHQLAVEQHDVDFYFSQLLDLVHGPFLVMIINYNYLTKIVRLKIHRELLSLEKDCLQIYGYDVRYDVMNLYL